MSETPEKAEKIMKIGKVTLDTRCWPGEDRYSDGGGTEERLTEIVTDTREEDFPAVIAREASWPILYHLSPIRENVMNWAGIREGERVLELGAGCGAVTGAFLKKGAKVTSVDLSLRRSRINALRHQDAENLEILIGAMEDVLPHLEGQYDHVTLIGVLEYAACFSDRPEPFRYMLEAAAGAMKEGGSLWVAIENRLGMKYFAGCREDHTGRYFEGIEDYPHRDGPYTFSRTELAALAASCGLDCRFYYPYPDYKFPVKIFSDEYLPRKGELTRNWQNFDADRVQLFDEGAAFDAAAGEGVFPVFANSFLAEMRRVKGADA